MIDSFLNLKSDSMKKLLSIVLISFYCLGAANAQEENDSTSRYFPENKDFGVTLNVSGLINSITVLPNQDLLNSNSLLLRYKQSERITYRLGIAPNIFRFNEQRTDSLGKDLVEFDSTASQSMISFRPGVEFHLNGTKRLDPYVAVDAEFGVIGKNNIGSTSNVTDTTGTSRVVRTITEDGGFVLGARATLGMNYFIAPKLFFGLEYGLGLSNIVSGGDRQEVVQFEPVSGSNTITRDLSSTRTSNLIFYVDPTVQITFGYFC